MYGVDGVRTCRKGAAAGLGTVPRCCARHAAAEFRLQLKTELNGKLDRFKGWRSLAVFGVPSMARRALRRCVGVCGCGSRLGVIFLRGCGGIGRQVSRWTLVVASGHTATNTPDLIRTPKLTVAGPGQYWGGGPPGKPFGCC